MLTRLRMMTAGESHGPGLVGILDGVPAGVGVGELRVAAEMERRQRGHGRSRRMGKEPDRVRFLGGVHDGHTLGSPVGVVIDNADEKPWQAFSVPRPGHADLAGMHKLGSTNARPVLERASARETAVRTALGSVARFLLEDLGIHVAGHVLAIGGARSPLFDDAPGAALFERTAQAIRARVLESDVSCLDEESGAAMVAAIDEAREGGDTVGGVFEVVVEGLPAGFGTWTQWDKKLSTRLAGMVMSVNALRGVELGLGFRAAERLGSEVHDAIVRGDDGELARMSNNAGGVEGGTSNGTPLVVRAAMKPIPTLMRPLPSVDLSTGEDASAHRERADSCAVPAACVVAEAMVCLAVADAILERTGGETLEEVSARMQQLPTLESS
jgi:chorismate synthase